MGPSSWTGARFSSAVEPDRAPSITHILSAVNGGWRSRAACRDEPDDELFLPDKALSRKRPGSPTILLALLACSRCEVRRECLTEAMTPIVSPIRRWDDAAGEFGRQDAGSNGLMLSGTWGGTSEADRVAVGLLPIAMAVDQLEASFPQRLAAEAQMFERQWAGRTARRSRAGRVRAMLAKPEVATLLAVTRRRCLACSGRLPALARADARYCGTRCRVAAHRARAA